MDGSRGGAALALALALAASLGLAGCGAKALTHEQVCQTAIYRLADGRLLDITPADGPDLRWRLGDGRTGDLHARQGWRSTRGWTTTPDGVRVRFAPCGAKTIAFADRGEGFEAGVRVPLSVRDATFAGAGGVKLAGRLVLPAGTGKVPILVEVHGSERSPALVYNFLQRLYPAEGVGVFVWDKRGTGVSGGHYTQDFTLLAADAAAAAREARRLAGPRLARIGFEGTSEGGWVAPMAARLTPVDFVIVDFGLDGSIAEENEDETALELARRGWPMPVLVAAAKVAEASDVLLASGFRHGYRRLDRLRARWGRTPWWGELHGQYAGLLVHKPDWMLRTLGPILYREFGASPVYYQPGPTLAAVKVPMLWVLADDDTLAPNTQTRRRLARLAAAGAPITVIAFPRAGHGILEYAGKPNGARDSTRYAPGYLRTNLDFARLGALRPPYGAASILALGGGRPQKAMPTLP